MVEGVKITLLVCLTSITLCVLILSYGEYTNRYQLVATQSNGVYIFDKKTITLNKCENGKCEVIHTNFAADRLSGISLTQAVPVNTNSPQNISSVTVSSGTSSETSPVLSSSVAPSQNPNVLAEQQHLNQTNASSQGNATTATSLQTLNPLANSLLNDDNRLPTLQSSLQQPTYNYQA